MKFDFFSRKKFKSDIYCKAAMIHQILSRLFVGNVERLSTRQTVHDILVLSYKSRYREIETSRLMMERTYGRGESTATFVSCLWTAEWRSSVSLVHSKEIVCTLFCNRGINSTKYSV